jgi:hypothetical protein
LAAADPNVPVDAPHWDHNPMAPKDSIPGIRVPVVGLYQPSEHRDRHLAASPQALFSDAPGSI